MKISVYNCQSSYRKVVKNAAKFFANRLIDDNKLIESLDIKIKFIPNLWADGFCEAIGDDDETTPQGFIIEIDEHLPAQEKLITLAHEFVHVKQYLMGELSVDHKYWRGRKVKNKNNITEPWEVEAYEREYELVLAWENA